MAERDEETVRDAVRWLRGWKAREGAPRGLRRRIERFNRWADAIERLAQRDSDTKRLLDDVDTFLRKARPLLGMSVYGSLGYDADRLIARLAARVSSVAGGGEKE